MKLIFCNECTDVVRLFEEKRSCKCGASSGRYIDDANAVFSGDCVVIGLHNYELSIATWKVMNKHHHLKGIEFKAFVIPFSSDRIKRID